MNPAERSADVLTELFGVRGKRVLMTGGARDLGAMIADGFVRAGARVYVSSRESERAAPAARINTAPIVLPGDVSSEAGCRDLAALFDEYEDGLDVLVNNAGQTSGAPLEEHDEAIWDRVLSVNLQGTFHLTRFMRPSLERGAPPARVINIGSLNGIGVTPRENYAYSASKVVVHHLSRHLALILAPAISPNAIAPGPFESEMTRKLPPADIERLEAQAALRGFGEPEDIAGAAIIFASRASSYLTGVVLPVDGGMSTTSLGRERLDRPARPNSLNRHAREVDIQR